MKFLQTTTTAVTLVSAAATFFFAPVLVSGECDGIQEAAVVTELDLFDSTVVTNTLHLPNGELRYNSKFFSIAAALRDNNKQERIILPHRRILTRSLLLLLLLNLVLFVIVG